MPRNLTFSTMHLVVQELKAKLQADMFLYGNQHGLDVTLQDFDYSTAWSEFMRMAIYGGSPDVSELGTTWINDFGSMNVLRPFTSVEVKQMGGIGTFVPAVWRSGFSELGDVWAIPWMTDLSLVCYRRDLLQKAGVKEEGAFSTPERFEQTLQQLKDAGIPLPWIAPTRRSYIMIHTLAMWLWNAGGDFVDLSGKTVLLNQPNARSGLRSFLRLYRFIPKELRNTAENEADGLFIQGKAAVSIIGPWGIVSSLNSEVGANLGLAIPLGCPHIGGAGLVVWKRTYDAQEAIQLVAHLTSREFQTVFPKIVGLLPGRPDSIETFPLPDTSYYPLIKQALNTGRSLPAIPLWGMVEDRVVNGLANLIADLFARPEVDLDELLDQHITPLVRRLEITLSQS